MASASAGRGEADDQSDDTGGRHRRLIEGAVVAGEIAAAVVADTRTVIDRSKKVIARPHIVITATRAGTPTPRQILVCERCGGNIETPGIAIMRGRTVMHVGCDWSATT